MCLMFPSDTPPQPSQHRRSPCLSVVSVLLTLRPAPVRKAEAPFLSSVRARPACSFLPLALMGSTAPEVGIENALATAETRLREVG